MCASTAVFRVWRDMGHISSRVDRERTTAVAMKGYPHSCVMGHGTALAECPVGSIRRPYFIPHYAPSFV